MHVILAFIVDILRLRMIVQLRNLCSVYELWKYAFAMLIFIKPICFLKSCIKNIAYYLACHSRYPTRTHNARIRHSMLRFKVLERRLWCADISITIQIISDIIFQHTFPSNEDHLSVQNYLRNLSTNQSGLRQSEKRSKLKMW